MTADEYELADGRHFDDPVIIERFNRVLDAVVPLMSKYGGFFISVGNEVNGWLKDRPAEVDGVVAFTAAARDYIHQIEPGMGVGITVGQSVLVEDPALLERLLAVSDAAAYTYYPMNGDFSVREPSGTAADIAEMIAAVGDLPVLFQEVGYPSGYTDAPGNNSSGEKQRDFFETFFTEIEQYPQVRFASLLQLADWSTGQCDAFVQYYTDLNSVPQVHEYLCSLGIRQHDGTAKPAYDAFLEAVRRIHAG
ncbi:MAG: hypothetical protein K8I60_22410 [Anaerolineae bacterium]|nr:hypothetical protein [Anaerolineae bacterium]